MTYHRVIPRDLFNEANLLKCLGKLSIHSDRLVVPTIRVVLEDDGLFGFVIEQNPADGAIYVVNVAVYIDNKLVPVYAGLNSRLPWPLYAVVDDEAVFLFNDQGELSDDFTVKFGHPINP